MDRRKLLSKITGLKKNDTDAGQKQSAKKPVSETVPEDETSWVSPNSEGQLSVDVYQTRDAIIIRSAVAGVSSEDIDISITNDMITIRGSRMLEEVTPEENYMYQECYWGTFSRSIILTEQVKADEATAEFKQGILTITLPKAAHTQMIKIAVDEP